MEIRYYLDPSTEEPHIYKHDVTENDVEEILQGPGEDLRAAGETRRKIGKTASGRILQVFYVPD